VLALVPLSMITRVLRAEMLEVLGANHVRFARAKGLRPGRIVTVHVLRSALIPILSMTGPLIGALVTGLFVVEYIFEIPGIGRFFIAAAGSGDYPLTLGLTVVLTIAIVVTNMLSDIAHAALDPRIRDTAR
jgi:oligopeptide transport system permease protein